MTAPTKARSGWGQIRGGNLHYFPEENPGRSLCGQHDAARVTNWPTRPSGWIGGGGVCTRCYAYHGRRTGKA